MKTGKAWWALIALLVVWTVPVLFMCINVVATVKFPLQNANAFGAIFGALALLCTGLLPVSIMLPSLLTWVDEKSIRQQYFFSPVEIQWEDLEGVSLSNHNKITFRSPKASISMSLFLSNAPDKELRFLLFMPEIEMAKQKMNTTQRSELEALQQEILKRKVN